jgi:transposase
MTNSQLFPPAAADRCPDGINDGASTSSGEPMTIAEDARREEARRLRVDPGLSLSELRKHFGVGNATLTVWLRGIEPPEWTRRPNAKDELRKQAIELRVRGWSVNDLDDRLGVVKSTAYTWVKHIPLDPDTERARQKREHSELMNAARWQAKRAERDRRQAEVHEKARQLVGIVSVRDVLTAGATNYWAEGAKSKPWRRSERLQFANQDLKLHRMFLSFLAANDRGRDSLKYRVHIHKTADAGAAADWWARELELPRDLFQRPTIKKHRPGTRRANTGDDYHGCLVITVPKSRELYWLVEGIVGALTKLG